MDSIEIRRLHIDDHAWERTSASWKDLKPLKDFNCHRDTDESIAQCTERLKPRFNIPVDVIGQWLYGHYYNPHTVDNYGWLDYDRISFEEATISATTLSTFHVIEQYRPYVERRGRAIPFDSFACTPGDKAHWREHQTWRVPPIVLDVSTIAGIPDYAEILGPFQLVEGHSRLGYLKAMLRAGLVAGDSPHRVYRMHQR